MNALKFILPVTASLLIATNVVALDVKDKLTDKISAFKDGTMNAFSGQLSESISSFAQENFESMKYLDFSLDLQEKLKPTFSIMSVNEIMKIDSGTVFNQTSLNNHDSDQTLNIGFGSRKLLNDNTLLLGANTFFDHQFSENHQRVGAGVEAITSIFDVRANYYNALSGRKTNDSGTIERAMDGWDLRADYHLPIKQDVNIFVSAFEFENPESASSYKETGNKYGADAKLGNFLLEGGYQDDNQANDYWFGNITYVVNFGSGEKDTSSNLTSLTDVSDKLYQPVKRENKIRVVKISASGLVAGGF